MYFSEIFKYNSAWFELSTYNVVIGIFQSWEYICFIDGFLYYLYKHFIIVRILENKVVWRILDDLLLDCWFLIIFFAN